MKTETPKAKKKTPNKKTAESSTPANSFAVFESQARVLLSSHAINAPLSSLSVDEQANSFALLKFIESVVEERKSELRESLLGHLETNGVLLEPDENKHRTLKLGNVTCVREFRQDSLPDAKKLKKVLNDSEVPLLDAFDEVKAMVLNPSKLAYLVDLGKVDKKKVEDLRPVSFALKTKASKALEEEFETLRQTTVFGA